MPSYIPVISQEDINKMSEQDYPEIAFNVLNRIIGDEIETDRLCAICKEAYNFDVPLENVTGKRFILRLDQGPTASFKDFAARMMSRLMQYRLSQENSSVTILTATSGDTGSAVASAYYGLENIKIVILFPMDEVSETQRRQMTTLGKNVNVVAINGKFDDCQRLVKTAFTDEFFANARLSSANSINIGRLLPQSVYYFYAWSRLRNGSNDIVFSVPSGNFGNLMGGIIAKKMGLPVKKFVVATNTNDEVPEYLRTGVYEIISPSINCISSAMNVGHPSNFARIISLYGGVMDEKGEIIKTPDLQTLREDFFGVSVTDEDTQSTIREVYESFGTILEPHGAVAWKGLSKYLDSYAGNAEQLSVSLETAHPGKFPDEIMKITGVEPDLPSCLEELDKKAESYTPLDNDYEKFKKLLLDII
jgi:threonine synthase